MSAQYQESTWLPQRYFIEGRQLGPLCSLLTISREKKQKWTLPSRTKGLPTSA